VEDRGHELIWNLSKGLYPIMSNPLPDTGPRLDALRTKQSLYYGVAAAEKMHLVAPVVQAVSTILEGNLPYVAAHAEKAISAMGSAESAWFGRALYVDKASPGKAALANLAVSALEEPGLASGALDLFRTLDEDPQAEKALNDFKARWDVMTASKSYKSLHTDQLSRPVLDFFEDRIKDPRAVETEHAVRRYLADHLESGEFDQILVLIAQNPARFENLLDTSSKYVKNGELKDFFAYLRQSMSKVN
jgi:hypothetical protein